MKRKVLYFLIGFGIFFSCSQSNNHKTPVNAGDLHSLMQEVTDITVHDIFSPPVASRVYVYSAISSYEVLALQDSSYSSLAGQINGLNPIPRPKDEQVNLLISALYANYLMSKKLIFSEEKIEEWLANWKTDLEKRGLNDSEWKASVEYATEVHQHMVDWANEDNYKETRTMSKHPLSDQAHHWEPTPPAYMAAIEPHWNKIRTFVLDSADQYIPQPPYEFSMEENSPFYKEMMEVYTVVKEVDEEKKEIASFWDCNPYVMNITGHVMFATKKITPGGHWMGITKIAALLDSADLIKSSHAYTKTSIALADGFISCWDEKYRSNLIRPETIINRSIDGDWTPTLQTPPFPEYTSGHSVISTAAANALTDVFGDNFSFVDSTEVKFGLPSREFNSFKEASQEAAISRLYGGIHYRRAIEEGIWQGNKIGDLIRKKLKFRDNQAIATN
ncbi:vanadium-dependent haloperoxidase [Marivirga harenae]|uniref:vanadium-dependent haloperoxidase n=1 Tax=Marivirga harenae TaxID=2010992 RepID=UPI0026DF2197|nr:vanadium-dependent haloperoxidase [Marivirga harenae]WKV11176.1 vanadium-dependent haloperoxidase [Marivirga harenae]